MGRNQGGGRLALADFLQYGLRLRTRSDAELIFQRLDASSVLAQGVRAISRLDVDSHQPSVRTFVSRIRFEETLGKSKHRVILRVDLVVFSQSVE